MLPGNEQEVGSLSHSLPADPWAGRLWLSVMDRFMVEQITSYDCCDKLFFIISDGDILE
jgi:hypothetical protein